MMADISKFPDLRIKEDALFDSFEDFVSAVEELIDETKVKLSTHHSKKLETYFKFHPIKKRKIMVKEEDDFDDEVTLDGSNEADDKTADLIEKFKYKTIILACKHYGKYSSSSKGIRLQQKTLKMMCPTHIAARFECHNEKMRITRLVIDCNHDLIDEQLPGPKFLKSTDQPIVRVDPVSGAKKYVKKRKRVVLKKQQILENVAHRVICPHRGSSKKSYCELYKLCNEDLEYVVSLLNFKTKNVQNQIILSWLEQIVIYSKANQKPDTAASSSSGKTVYLKYFFPTPSGIKVRVCGKSFCSLLDLKDSDIEKLLMNQDIPVGENSITQPTIYRIDGQNRAYATTELETSVASILERLGRDNREDNVIISTNDLNTEDYGSSMDCDDTFCGANEIVVSTARDGVSTPREVRHPTIVSISKDVHLTIPAESGTKRGTSSISLQDLDGQTLNCRLFRDSIVEGHEQEEGEERFYFFSISWSKNEENPNLYYKIDENLGTILMMVKFENLSIKSAKPSFSLKICNKSVSTANNPFLRNINKQFSLKPDMKMVLDRLNNLCLCKGIKGGGFRNMFLQSVELSNCSYYCFYTYGLKSNDCKLFVSEESDEIICSECCKLKANLSQSEVETPKRTIK